MLANTIKPCHQSDGLANRQISIEVVGLRAVTYDSVQFFRASHKLTDVGTVDKYLTTRDSLESDKAVEGRTLSSTINSEQRENISSLDTEGCALYCGKANISRILLRRRFSTLCILLRSESWSVLAITFSGIRSLRMVALYKIVDE